MKLQDRINYLNARLGNRKIIYRSEPFMFFRKQYSTHDYTFLDISVCSKYDYSGHLVAKDCSIVLRLTVLNNTYIPDLVRNLKFDIVQSDTVLSYFENIAKDRKYDVDYDLISILKAFAVKEINYLPAASA
jgi:hypothetical protein